MLNRKLCKCGCGEEVISGDFIYQHYFRWLNAVDNPMTHKSIRKKASKAATKRWSSTKERKRQAKRIRKTHNTPKFIEAKKSQINEFYASKEGKKARKKISATLAAKYASGELIPTVMSEEAKLRSSKRMQDKWEDPIFRQKMSKKHYQSGHIKTHKGTPRKIYYRGSWERFFILLLDSSSIVKHFEWEPFSIPYYCRHKDRRYYPDCLVTLKDGSKWLVEIKGEKDFRYESKVLAAEIYCRKRGYEYVVINETPMHPITQYLQ